MTDLFETACPCCGRDYEKSAPVGFDEFWEMYPRNAGKAAAKKKYEAALKRYRHDDIMFGLSQHLPDLSSKETQFIPHASTWLHGERFNDQPEEPNNLAGARNPDADATTRAIANAGSARRTPSKDCF